MGFYDRNYARRPDDRRDRIPLVIIGVTVVAYLVQGFVLGRAGVDLARFLGVVPGRLVGSGWVWQLLTHVLLHEPHDLWHLVFNMLFLYWFGPDVAEIYGTRRFLLLYLGGAACCAAAYCAVGYATRQIWIPAIGASGAIMAVAVVAACLYPNRKMLFMWVIPLPLWALISIYVAYDLYYPLVGLRDWLGSAGHLGGALFGFLCHRLHWEVPNPRPFLDRLAGLFRQRGPSPAEVDRILGKISRDGIGALSDGERDVLRRASKES